MPWAGATWALLTTESSYGTYNVAGTTLYPTLDGNNSFTMRPVPQRQIIRTADGGNRRKFVVANRTTCVGKLETVLHPDQCSFWATMLTPTGSPAALPSFTIDYWDSVRAQRYLGAIPDSFTVTTSATQDYAKLSVNFVAQKRDATFTTFAQPAESNYSSLVPYGHVETAGNVKLAGSAITNYQSMSVTIKNVLQGTWDEQSFITSLLYCGRDLDFTLGPQYTATAYRGDFEAQTPLTWILKFARTSPSHTFTITCETATYLSNIADNLPLGGAAYQTLSAQCFYDAANTADFTIAGT
jgi:Phage tail tube protein